MNVFLIIIFALSLTACTTKQYLQPVSKHSQDIENINSKDSLCSYHAQKGIAELVKIHRGNYSFIFYPGDEKIHLTYAMITNLLSTEDLNNLSVHDEFKAILKIMDEIKYNCPRFELIFIP